MTGVVVSRASGLEKWVSCLVLVWALGMAAGTAAAAPARSAKATLASAAQVEAASRATAHSPRQTAGRASMPRKSARRAALPSVGQIAGLHATSDALDLRSSVALVVDQQTDEVVFSKNAHAVLPIASITKLMTALVVAESDLPLDEVIAITADDVRATSASNARSRLVQGTRLTRGEMLHLALMSSDNRAAHALARSHPAGLGAFVEAMNAKAALLGMDDTRYVEPTGLSSDNRSSAPDLARLVRAASEHAVIRDYSTATEASVAVGRRQVQFRNTNGLVRHPEWDILLQKTGYISAAGRCVVMQAQLAGRQFIMVLLDSAGKYTRIADAERLRKWLTSSLLQAAAGTSVSALDGDASSLGTQPR